MGQKRQFESEQASAKKRHRGNDHENTSFSRKHAGRADSSGWSKKRARAIERRMKHGAEGLPANVQQDLERELAMLRRQLDVRQAKKQRANMISKYHMIRFFERKKAIRLGKQLRRRLEATDDAAEKAALEADLHIAEVDRLYAIYFPFMEPYVSLYPAEGRKGKDDKEKNEKEKDEKDEKSSKAAQLLHAPRPPLWTTVEAAMRDGGVAALERLQERQPGRPDAPDKAAKPDKPAGRAAGRAAGKAARNSDIPVRKPAYEAVEDDSDGGFFE